VSVRIAANGFLFILATPIALMPVRRPEDNGVSRMREVRAVELEPGTKVIFKPGEMHMMIVGLKQPLKEGQTFPLTLQFEKAGHIDVNVPIEKVGAMKHEDIGPNMQMPNDQTGK
jgi:copper(I)-binding protein